MAKTADCTIMKAYTLKINSKTDCRFIVILIRKRAITILGRILYVIPDKSKIKIEPAGQFILKRCNQMVFIGTGIFICQGNLIILIERISRECIFRCL